MNWGLIGNGWAVSGLSRHIADQRVRHAYLFTGPDAVGKRTLAMRFARALNCEKAPRPGEICDDTISEPCRVCRTVPLGAYPDLHVLTPEESIRVDEIRQLQSRLALAPYEGRWRIALLTDFHQATISSANAMLKTLEEPPSRVVLLLTCPEAESLLPTVASRCEIVPLRQVPSATIAQALRERDVEPEKAELLAAISGGRPGRAISLAEDSATMRGREAAFQELSDLMEMDLPGRFAYVNRLLSKGELPEQRRRVEGVLDEWLSLWRDLLYQSYGAEVAARNPDRLPAMARRTNALTPAQHRFIVNTIAESLQAVEANANLRLTLETLLIDLPSWEGNGTGEGA